MYKSVVKSFVLFFIVVTIVAPVFGDKYDEISQELGQVRKLLEDSRKTSKPLEENLQKAETSLKKINDQIGFFEIDIKTKEKDISLGETDLLKQKKIIDERARKYYKTSRLYLNNLIGLFLSRGLTEATRDYYVHQQGVQRDRTQLLKTALFIRTLEEKKAQLTAETKQLEIVKSAVNKERNFFDAEVAKAREYQSSLQQKIARLSALQQQLIAQKLAGLNIPQSAGSAVGSCSSDLTNGKNPGFSPRLGFFTFGVPNRVGLNQYGAWGRAKAGQGHEDILKAYYNFDSINTYDTNTQINVQGYGTFSLEDYVKRIYEVPDSWTDNNLAVLKAQAIAARSYVLAYTNNGQGSICTTEQCQVFKPDPKGGNWEQAVNATSGQVMVLSGQPIKAWFSSTHGGYVFSSSEIGWSGTAWTKNARDTTGDVSSFTDLMNNAYDKDSPWFYCNWGSRAEYDKTAWLKPEEVADIANTILLAKTDNGTQEHLYQPDKGNPAGTDTWDSERVKQELKNRNITPFSRAQNVTIDWDKGSGKTTTVTVSGDGASASFNGSEFKNFFNLRAPANIQIVGPLYNVETR